MTHLATHERTIPARMAPSLHHRGDIQGLRAVAVAAVVLAHAGVTALGGGFVGVDLFFVLSGFLITELLIREWEKKGHISLAGFWARRARRLLPASTLVLTVTAIASAILLPITQRASIVTDIVWSALFAANWRFAQQQTDYFAQDRAISPVQHFWSLGVEEQFYVAWPLLVVVCGVIARRMATRRGSSRGSIRLTVGVVAACVVAVSLAYSIHLTSVNQPYAYFGTPARAWQLGLGALLAAIAPMLGRLGKRTCTTFAIVGAIGFATSVLLLSETGEGPSYPGTVALLPTVSAGLLIAAGIPSAGTVVGAVLAWRPLQWLGDISYSLYLWHFPILIIGLAQVTSPGWLVRAALVAAAVVAAALSTHLLETRVRTLPALVRHAGLSLGLGAVLVGLASAVAVASPHLSSDSTTSVINAQGQRVHLTPALTDPLAGFDRGPHAELCSLGFEQVVPDACDFADTTSSKRAVLLGDSHAGAIFYGIRAAADDAGWRLSWWSKNACNISDVTVYDKARSTRFTECDEFRRRIFARTIAAKPDLVVLSSARNVNKQVYDRTTGAKLSRQRSYDAILEGWRSTIRTFTDQGIRVAVIQDWPRAPRDPVECLARERDARRCTFDRSSTPNPETLAVQGLSDVTLIDVDDEFCSATTCTPVVGSTLVYRDTSHVTRAYSERLSPLLGTRLFGR